MRILILTLLLALPLVSSCAVRVYDDGPGYRGHSRHSSHRHSRHRSHSHWNAAGPAYAEAATMTDLVILSATLPATIDGTFTEADEKLWRRDWPMRGAQLLADGLTRQTNGLVTGSVSQTKPASGYYMELKITYLDVGDVRPNADGTPGGLGSALAAHGVIMNGATGQMVADVKFSESMGWSGSLPYEYFLDQAGESLGEWFLNKRKQAGAGSDK